jgi:methionine aminotransferase
MTLIGVSSLDRELHHNNCRRLGSPGERVRDIRRPVRQLMHRRGKVFTALPTGLRVAPTTSKLPDVGTTIFTVMSALAADCGAINLSQGFPDFAAPEGLLERVNHHLRAAHNQYAPMAGLPALREAIAAKTLACYAHRADPEQEITVTSGATEALFCAIEAFVHPGDEVIVFDPAYDSYDPAIRLAGGRPVHVPLRSPDFSLDFSALEAAIGASTRMLILNTPHNPTGAILTGDDLQRLADLVRNTDILLLGDEVYEHMVYGDVRHESLLRYPELAERSLAVFSFGKTYHVTGWKIGYVVASPALTREFRRVHQFVQFCVATPLQHGLADFLASDPGHYRELPAFYAGKRDYFCQLLANSRFRLQPSAGTYFQLANYGEISDETDTVFAERLTRESGVACIPISVFYASPPAAQRLVRFCFAKDNQTLERAAEILCAI